jgi:gluconolactonase
MYASHSDVFVAHDRAFHEITGDHPRLEKLIDVDAHEGPVYVRAEDALYFTSVPALRDIRAPRTPSVAIRRLQLDGLAFPRTASDVSTVRACANMANGMALDDDGRRLLVCEQGTRFEHAAITRFDPPTQCAEVLVDQWRGLRLNSPNDVVQKRDGSIWFTDPGYGFLQGFRPEPQLGDFVYRYDPDSRQPSVVADGFDKPNGLAFSPDESILYVGDSGAIHAPGDPAVNRPHHVVAFEIRDGRHLTAERLFAVITPGFPDGIKTDAAGRVYVSSASGVQVFSPEADLLGEIHLPGAVNFTFGGADDNVLFITADTAIYAVCLRAVGR